MNILDAWEENKAFLQQYDLRQRTDWMERFSLGIAAFMKAVATWDGCRYQREGRTFRDWLKHIFRNKLCKWHKRESPRRHRLLEEHILWEPSNTLETTLEPFTGDERVMVTTLLAIDTSGMGRDRDAYHGKDRRHGFPVKRLTGILHARLRGTGWDDARIQATTRRIKEVMTGCS